MKCLEYTPVLVCNNIIIGRAIAPEKFFVDLLQAHGLVKALQNKSPLSALVFN